MKQKKIGDILYVFDTEAYEITQDTDAAIIYVQEGTVEDFKALNGSLENIKPYNYLKMVVQTPVWAQYVDDPDPEPDPEPKGHYIDINSEVTLAENALKLYGGGTVDQTNIEANTRLTIDAPEGFKFDPTSETEAKVLTATFSDGQTPELADNFVGFTMPDEDLTVNIEIVEQFPTFATLNISQDAEHNISATVIADIDLTNKTYFAQNDENDNINFYIKLVPDENNPTLLVLDKNYDGNIATDTYLDEHPTGTCTITDSDDPTLIYTCDYSWTNDAVEQ